MTRIFNISDMESYCEEQANKFGFFATENNSVCMWCLKPNQEIPIHCHTNGDDTWIILKGRGYYYLLDGIAELQNTYEPNPKEVVVPPFKIKYDNIPFTEVKTGMVIVNPQNMYHGIKNSDEGNMVIVSITGPNPVGCRYVAR